MNNDNLLSLPAYLNPCFAADMLAVVDRAGHKLSFDDMLLDLGFSTDDKDARDALSAHAKGLEQIGITGSTKGQGGFGRKGMKVREKESITVTDSDMTDMWIAATQDRILALSSVIDLKNGVSLASLAATLFSNNRKDQLILQKAVQNKRLSGFKQEGSLLKLA